MLRAKSEEKLARLEARSGKEQRELERDQQEHRARRVDEIVNAGETLAGLLLGARSLTGVAGRRRMTAGSGARVEKSRGELEAARAEIQRAQEAAAAAIAAVKARWEATAGGIVEAPLRPRKAGVEVLEVGLLWKPEIKA